MPKIGDITKTMPKITLETFQRKFLVGFSILSTLILSFFLSVETNWKHKLSSLALASTVNFQENTSDDDKKGAELFKGKTLDDIKETLIDIKYHPLTTHCAPDASYKFENFLLEILLSFGAVHIFTYFLY